MSSVSDLINLAQFRLANKSQTPQKIGDLIQVISQQVEKVNSKRRQQENQKRLSGLLMKNVGNLESEYNVDETGNISVKYKTKKKDFSNAIKEASLRIKSGEDFGIVSGELAAEFPNAYTNKIGEYLLKISTPKPDPDVEQTTGKSNIIAPKEVGRFNPLRMLPQFAYPGGNKAAAPAQDSSGADQYGFKLNQEASKGGKKYIYIGNNQWQEK